MIKRLLFLLLGLYICITTVNAQGITWQPNSFWLITNTAEIYQFTLAGDTILNNAPSDSFYFGTGVNSLAYCNNLNGGGFSPTFYSGDGLGHTYYVEDSAWVECSQQTSLLNSNCGGNGNHLYFEDNSPELPNIIFSYNGTAYNNVFVDSVHYFIGADISVDDSGNIYVFRGETQAESNWLTVISPAGNIIRQYNFSFNSANAYGTFLMNDKLYICFGSESPTYPNKILPLVIGYDTVIAEPTINMPLTSAFFYDAASGTTGVPTAIKNITAQMLPLKVFPNPAGDVVNITCSQPFSFIVYNLMGQVVYSGNADEQTTTLNVSNYANGMYLLVAAQGSTKSAEEKFIVQH